MYTRTNAKGGGGLGLGGMCDADRLHLDYCYGRLRDAIWVNLEHGTFLLPG